MPELVDQQPLHNMTAKRKWRIVVLVVALAAACLFHAPLLRGLIGLLIVDQPTDDYDCVCITCWGHCPNGDRCYDVAADLYRRKPSCRVLVVAPAPGRLDQTGAMPSFAVISRRELLARGVPKDAVTVLRGERWNDWAAARALSAWMQNHPGRSTLLLTAQFHSGQSRRALDDVLAPELAASVRVHPLPHRDYDNTNWWTRRCGYRAFGTSWLLRLHGRPSDADETTAKTADTFERDFLQSFRESTP
jgi:hypothetical protein